MKRETKSNWQTIVFATIATIIIFGVSASTFAQSAAYSNHQAIGQLFTSAADRNLRLKDTARKFDLTTIKLNAWLNENLTLAVEYPKPDFSAMEQWYEIVKYEYDFFTDPLLPRLYFVVKPKVENPPRTFKMKFADADEVAISNYQVFGIRLPITVGEPQRIYGMAPKEKDMPKVKSIVVYRIIE